MSVRWSAKRSNQAYKQDACNQALQTGCVVANNFESRLNAVFLLKKKKNFESRALERTSYLPQGPGPVDVAVVGAENGVARSGGGVAQIHETLVRVAQEQVHGAVDEGLEPDIIFVEVDLIASEQRPRQELRIWAGDVLVQVPTVDRPQLVEVINSYFQEHAGDGNRKAESELASVDCTHVR